MYAGSRASLRGKVQLLRAAWHAGHSLRELPPLARKGDAETAFARGFVDEPRRGEIGQRIACEEEHRALARASSTPLRAGCELGEIGVVRAGEGQLAGAAKRLALPMIVRREDLDASDRFGAPGATKIDGADERARCEPFRVEEGRRPGRIGDARDDDV